MSLYNYFAVKSVSKSSIKKKHEEGLQLNSGEDFSKSDIDHNHIIQPAQNGVGIGPEKTDSNIEIANLEAFPEESKLLNGTLNSDKNTEISKKSAENIPKSSFISSSSKQNVDKAISNNANSSHKKWDNSSIHPESFESKTPLKQTTLNYGKTESQQHSIAVTENLVNTLHKSSDNKVQQSETDSELITTNDSTLTNGHTEESECHETLEYISQEKKNSELTPTNFSSLQLDKEETSLESTKSFAESNSTYYTENDSILKQDIASDIPLTPKPSPIKASDNYINGGLDEEELSGFGYDDDNSIHLKYITNAFEENIEAIIKSESYLFLDSQIKWWTKYNNLSPYSKQLLVRLYIGKYSWYRQNQLTKHVPNIEEFDGCIEELINSELFLSASPKIVTLEGILNQLTIPELKDVIRRTLYKKVRITKTKQSIVNSILKAAEIAPIYSMFGATTNNSLSPLETKVFNSCLKVAGGLLIINKEAWKFFNLVNRAFTHYGEQHDRHAIIHNLKSKISNINYMNYKVSRSGKVFPNRESLLKFNKAVWIMNDISNDFNTSSTSPTKFEDICKRIEPVIEVWRRIVKYNYSGYNSNYLSRFTPAFVCTKIIHMYYLPSLAKLKLYSEEIKIFGELLNQTNFLQNERINWWNRLITIQDIHLSKDNKKSRQNAYHNCICALNEAINNKIYSESAAEIYERMVKLEKKLNIKKKESRNFKELRPFNPPITTIRAISTPTISNKQVVKHLWKIEATEEEVCAEEFVLNYLAQEEWKGSHSKNEVLTTLFALIFLDILFLPLPGVFETPYQTHPLDLGTEAFYLDRMSDIDARLYRIEGMDFADLIDTHYLEHCEERPNVIGLNWSFELNDLIEIAYYIGGRPLSKIFKLYCVDYFAYTSTFPDLCIWKSMGQTCKFIKVKTLSDTLPENQKNCMGFLMRCRIKAAVYLLKDSNNNRQ